MDVWQEVLYARIGGKFLDLRQSEATAESERILDLDPSIYFYVNAPHPHFGQQIAIFSVDDVDDSRYVRVTPFDTGGLALGHIPLRPDAVEVNHRVFVQKFSFEIDEYWVDFLTWVRAAYRRFANYVESRRPSHHFVSEIDLDHCSSSQAWFWEARMHRMRVLPVRTSAQRVVLGPGDRRRFLAWLGRMGGHGTAEAVEVARRFLSVSEESRDPAGRAAVYVMEKGVKR